MSRLAIVASLTLLASLVLAGVRTPDAEPATIGAFSPTGSLAEPRWWHTAAALPDGRVLIVGGISAGVTEAEQPTLAEVWDPATGRFGTAGSLAEPRWYHTATTLPDGRVLVVGGFDPRGEGYAASAPAVIWDPATRVFLPAEGLTEGRVGHTATLLPDGRVLIIGGDAEIWDPATGESTPTGPLVKPRVQHTATVLPDGRLVVIGGTRGGSKLLKSIEVWDPMTREFRTAGALPEARLYPTATLLPDGRIAILGGVGEDLPTEVLTWDPVTEETSVAGSLLEGRANHTATLLLDGRVLVVGGGLVDMGAAMAGNAFLLATAEVWDPVTGRSSPAGTMREDRVYHTATLLPDGRVLVVGGPGSGDPGTPGVAEVWEPDGAMVPTPGPTVSPSPTSPLEASNGPGPTATTVSAPSLPGEGTCATYEVADTTTGPVTRETIEQVASIIEDRLDAAGVAEPIVYVDDVDRVRVGLPMIAPDSAVGQALRDLIGTTGEVEFVPVPPAYFGQAYQGVPLPEGMADTEPLFTGVEIADARLGQDPTTNEIVVDLELKETGARLFDEYAAEHYGEQFAIVLDGIVQSAPTINATRFGGRAQIGGMFTAEEATSLVTVLRSGSLPLGIQEVSYTACEGPPAAAQSPPTTTEDLLAGFVTEEVEPGVFRVVSDGVRDLTFRRVQAGDFGLAVPVIATGRDDGVWVLHLDRFYRLGHDETYRWPGERLGIVSDFEVAPDGSVWAVLGSGIYSFEDGEWSRHLGTPAFDAPIEVTPDGTVWAKWLKDPEVGSWEQEEEFGYLEAGEWQVVGDWPFEFGDLLVPAADDVWAIGGTYDIPEGYDMVTSFPHRFVDGAWQRYDQGVQTTDIGPDGTLWALGGRDVDWVLSRFDGSAWVSWPPPDWMTVDHRVFKPKGDAWVPVKVPAEGDLEGVMYLWGWPLGDVRVAPDGSVWVTYISGLPEWRQEPACFEGTGGLVHFDATTWSRHLTDQCVEAMDIAADGSVWVIAGDLWGGDDLHSIYVITPEAVAATG